MKTVDEIAQAIRELPQESLALLVSSLSSDYTKDRTDTMSVMQYLYTTPRATYQARAEQGMTYNKQAERYAK